MRKLLFLSAFSIFLLSTIIVNAAVDVVLFNESFTRGTGTPVTVSRSFPGVSGAAIVKLWNGDAEDSTVEKVSSSTVLTTRS